METVLELKIDYLRRMLKLMQKAQAFTETAMAVHETDGQGANHGSELEGIDDMMQSARTMMNNIVLMLGENLAETKLNAKKTHHMTV